MQSGRKASEIQFTNSLGCVRHIMKVDGFKGLYKGNEQYTSISYVNITRH